MGRPIHKEDAMGNEFTGFEDNAPTLTLEPDLGEPKAEIEKRDGADHSYPRGTADGRQLC